MNKLKDLIIEIDMGIDNLKQNFNDELYNDIHQKLLKLDGLINSNQIPNDIYQELIKFHHNRRLQHASLKRMNNRKK